MATAALDATLGRLTQSVTDRIANDERFKQNVYDTINRILSRLNECAAAVSAASSGPERAAAAVDLSRQVAALNAEILRLQSNQLNQGDVDYVTNPLNVESTANNLKWDTAAKKRAFLPPAYRPGSGASVGPPPYPGTSSSRFSGWPFSSSTSPSSSTSSSQKDDDLEPEDVEEIVEDVEDEEIVEDEDDIEDEDLDVEDDELTGGGPDDLESGEIDEEAEEEGVKNKRSKKIPVKTVYKNTIIDDDEEDDDEDGELYLQKFDSSINDNYVLNYHPECAVQNYDEILSMIVVLRDKSGIIIDDLHKTIPYLTKYERARILGQRAKQINSGSPPFVKVPENVIDGYIIAELELKEKKIPFIIRRPLPNGGSEYWSIKDLEDISF
jgi:DNA-directed RNA polymerase I, II, and III subunit RPABC2